MDPLELLIVRLINGSEMIGLVEKTETHYIIENPLCIVIDSLTGGIGLVDPLILSSEKEILVANKSVIYEYHPIDRVIDYYRRSYKFYTSSEYQQQKCDQMDRVISRFDEKRSFDK